MANAMRAIATVKLDCSTYGSKWKIPLACRSFRCMHLHDYSLFKETIAEFDMEIIDNFIAMLRHSKC